MKLVLAVFALSIASAQTFSPVLSAISTVPGSSVNLSFVYQDSAIPSNTAAVQFGINIPPGVLTGLYLLAQPSVSAFKTVNVGGGSIAIAPITPSNNIPLPAGVLLTVPIFISTTAAPGSISISLTGIIATTSTGTAVTVSTTPVSLTILPNPSIVTINCGSSMDRFFSAGTAPFAVPLPAFPTLRYATFFTYSIPVPNGFYSIAITLVEPNKTAAGQRTMTISANGAASAKIDVFAAAGGALIPLIYPMFAAVNNGILTLAFQGLAGQNAIVSKIVVAPFGLAGSLTGAQSTNFAPGSLAVQSQDGTFIPVVVVGPAGLVTQAQAAIDMTGKPALVYEAGPGRVAKWNRVTPSKGQPSNP